ncbi:transcriptional regulatory protein [Embleya hyalina]|uniref:Transcriptional regulatory protein n=1 Tax=Embleya hyalina TaxID=516124 RepID=A0A401YKA1_9ACTN|nr:transcriptional regulatory protein [Embleya hyalina]
MIGTLVVEDDPVLADAHAVFTGRVPGFEIAGVGGSGTEAPRLLSTRRVDLVLLDLYLPDLHGLDPCRSMRAQGHEADVVAVTSAREPRYGGAGRPEYVHRRHTPGTSGQAAGDDGDAERPGGVPPGANP